MNSILQYFNLPDSCYFDSNIPKKMFYDSGSLNATDKKIFTDVIDKITLRNQLNKQTINIESYHDDIRSYSEVAFITIKLREIKKHIRIAQIVQQTIPYPIVLSIECDGKSMINVCHKRTNQADSSKNTIEESHNTDWIDNNNLSINEEQFLNSLSVPYLSHTNLYNFYSDIVSRVIIFKASKYTDDFDCIKNLDAIKANQILLEINQIDNDILHLRSKIKNEVHFSKKMQMNVEIKKLEDIKSRQVALLAL